MELKSYLCDLTEKESEQSNTHVFPVDELELLPIAEI